MAVLWRIGELLFESEAGGGAGTRWRQGRHGDGRQATVSRGDDRLAPISRRPASGAVASTADRAIRPIEERPLVGAPRVKRRVDERAQGRGGYSHERSIKSI